jgi:hypothetical protein
MVLCRWILCQTNEYWSATKIKSVLHKKKSIVFFRKYPKIRNQLNFVQLIFVILRLIL